MADEKTYYPTVIEDAPFPQEGTPVENPVSSSAGVLNPATVKEQSFPTKRVAVELLSSAINTRSKKILQEFQFTKSGAIQVGEYQNGVSGDLKLSPAGIVARNTSGITTFAIDGETGDATFAGVVQAGTLISGAVAVGDGSILIDGETKRMIFYDDNNIPVIVIGNA